MILSLIYQLELFLLEYEVQRYGTLIAADMKYLLDILESNPPLFFLYTLEDGTHSISSISLTFRQITFI